MPEGKQGKFSLQAGWCSLQPVPRSNLPAARQEALTAGSLKCTPFSATSLGEVHT